LERSAKAFTKRILGRRTAFLELPGEVFDGRQRAENVNLLIRCVDVNLQLASVRAHANVLVVIVNFNEVGIRVFFSSLTMA